MKRKQKAPIFQISIDEADEKTGVNLISFVSRPAIEADFVALSEKKVQLAQDGHKQILTGPVLIPDKRIFRLSEDEEPFYISFAADTIERIRNKFHKNQFTHATNDEHELPLDGNYVVESWIIADAEKDKAVALGLSDLPAGTWMVSYHVPDADYWEKEILSGNKRGFSLEGFFNYEEIKEQLSKIDMPKKEKGWFQRMSALKLSTIELEDGSTIVHDPISNKLYSDDNTILPSGTYKTRQGVQFKVETSTSVYQWWYQDSEKLNKTEMKKNPKKPGLLAQMKAKLAAWLAMATMTLEDGSSIEIDDETKEVFKLDEEGNRGEPVADGTYTLEDGTTITVEGGKLKEESSEEEMEATALADGSYELPGGDVLTIAEGAYAIATSGGGAAAEEAAAEIEALKKAHAEEIKQKTAEIAKLSATVESQKVLLSKRPATRPVKLGGDKTEPEAKTPAQQRLSELRGRHNK